MKSYKVMKEIQHLGIRTEKCVLKTFSTFEAAMEYLADLHRRASQKQFCVLTNGKKQFRCGDDYRMLVFSVK